MHARQSYVAKINFKLSCVLDNCFVHFCNAHSIHLCIYALIDVSVLSFQKKIIRIYFILSCIFKKNNIKN
jgi:hypothetical protein